ncbi:hypothetical protein CTI12_AA013290 [Artemisia annua]|uniref:Uncharacterized protein n=1 Tax=Artemisia annua TaxID=35608 RepID=A0A2U1QM61_ARTAN|nr:hypothetical protein CTI12_AA013290 [Artemisia annua]
MQLKEREQIERERQLKETEVIERETDKDNQTEDETVNEGNASDASMVFTGSDTSSYQQIEDSSPRYDSDADGTHRNEAIWDSEDDYIRPSSDTEILATSVKPHLKQKEALEFGYREAVLAKKRSIQQLDQQMVLNNRKVQALLKDNSDLKSENSRLQKTNSNFEILNTKLENENQEFLKQANDIENKLRKLGQTTQTLNMLPTRDEDINTETSGIGFENIDHLENEKPGFLNKVQKLTSILYNAEDMGKELSTDLLFESQDILNSEEEKRLKVKQRKTPFSYHDFVYGCTQLTEIPKEPFKRKDKNVKRFFKEAQLATYDANLWQNNARKQFCHLKHHID